MNLFNKIPDNFFSILSSKNKNIYGLALVTFYDALEMYHSKIRKSDYLDLLKYRGANEINSLIIEDDFAPIVLPEMCVQDIDTLEDWKIAEMKYRLLRGEEIRTV